MHARQRGGRPRLGISTLLNSFQHNHMPTHTPSERSAAAEPQHTHMMRTSSSRTRVAVSPSLQWLCTMLITCRPHTNVWIISDHFVMNSNTDLEVILGVPNEWVTRPGLNSVFITAVLRCSGLLPDSTAETSTWFAPLLVFCLPCGTSAPAQHEPRPSAAGPTPSRKSMPSPGGRVRERHEYGKRNK